MKNIKILLATAVIAAFTLTSCSKDDNNTGPVTNGSITEKWNQTKSVVSANNQNITQNYIDNEVGCTKDFIQFTTTNAFNNVVYYKNADNACTEDAASPVTYIKSTNALTINGGEYDGTYTITTLSGSELIVKSVETISGTEITTTTYFSKAAN